MKFARLAFGAVLCLAASAHAAELGKEAIGKGKTVQSYETVSSVIIRNDEIIIQWEAAEFDTTDATKPLSAPRPTLTTQALVKDRLTTKHGTVTGQQVMDWLAAEAKDLRQKRLDEIAALEAAAKKNSAPGLSPPAAATP